MKLPIVIKLGDGTPDPLMTLIILSVLTCLVKLIIDGASFVIFNHPVTFGHTDSSAYVSILGPLLASHGYISVNGITPTKPEGQ